MATLKNVFRTLKLHERAIRAADRIRASRTSGAFLRAEIVLARWQAWMIRTQTV